MNALVNIENQTPFIEVELNGKIQLGVNARDLHKMLEVKADFSHWIKRRITQCKFEENYDFIKLVKKNELSKTGQWVTDYIISVDMTKHLGMMERNEKGHEIRKYYIEQEEVARQLKDGLQIKIGNISAQFEMITNSLSDAARFLVVHGKQTKPLVGSLVSFLAKKGVIDINEYIEFTEQTKKSITTDSEALNERIEIYFNSHINDLRKPA
nr:antA/AntB antirepressor family protein [Acinetobacter equi]